ncbi:unnamed protein product [Clonostachys byssicola]|uniref:Uncharacterized protein n=1 Tax=Clonostachys byssicola TaxID=160290 RepID=A0A9N9Y2Z3_9HYPO|nr:unnamed protein product [Clonostachys byssicola]
MRRSLITLFSRIPGGEKRSAITTFNPKLTSTTVHLLRLVNRNPTTLHPHDHPFGISKSLNSGSVGGLQEDGPFRSLLLPKSFFFILATGTFLALKIH